MYTSTYVPYSDTISTSDTLNSITNSTSYLDTPPWFKRTTQTHQASEHNS